MKIKPLFDRIVIKQFEAKEKTESGLFLPTSSQEKPQMGKVVFVGQGGKLDGNEIVFMLNLATQFSIPSLQEWNISLETKPIQ